MKSIHKFTPISSPYYPNAFHLAEKLTRLLFLFFTVLLIFFTFIIFPFSFPIAKADTETVNAETVPEKSINDMIDEDFPLTSPFYSDKKILSYAESIGLRPASMSYLSIDSHLKNISKYFTPQGYESFISDIELSGMADFIRDNKISVLYGTRGEPEIIKKGIINSRYRWFVSVPAFFIFRNAEGTFKYDVTIKMEIIRSNINVNYIAVAIHNWIAIPIK